MNSGGADMVSFRESETRESGMDVIVAAIVLLTQQATDLITFFGKT